MKRTAICLSILLLFLASCINSDPLSDIRKLSRTAIIQTKHETKIDEEKIEKVSMYYRQSIDTLVDAYKSYGSFNKYVGEKLMLSTDFKDAVKHLEIAKEIRNDDANIYYWLGVCYTNLYRIENDDSHLLEAEKNYETALRVSPDHSELLYSYSHLLVYVKKDYTRAAELLERYISDLEKKGRPQFDIKVYLLLARTYFLSGDMARSYKAYLEADKFRSILNKEDQKKLDEFFQSFPEDVRNSYGK